QADDFARFARQEEGTGSLRPEDIEFGREQVQDMLHDLPVMHECITGGDEIFQWAARQYAGVRTMGRIKWTGTHPAAGIDRECSFAPTRGIRVSPKWVNGPLAGRAKTCSELWSAVVYELLNLRNEAQFRAIVEDATHRRITLGEWIGRHAVAESY